MSQADVTTDAESRCVVCGGIISGDAHFPNAWERALGQRPCCSADCAGRYDADVHWIPSTRPEPVPDDEHDRLLAVCRSRLAQGDKATVLVREMLHAGVPPESLRKVVFFSSVDASKSKQDAREKNVLGAIFGVLTGSIFFAQNRDTRDQSDHDAALSDLEVWERAFGEKAR